MQPEQREPLEVWSCKLSEQTEAIQRKKLISSSVSGKIEPFESSSRACTASAAVAII